MGEGREEGNWRCCLHASRGVVGPDCNVWLVVTYAKWLVSRTNHNSTLLNGDWQLVFH